jgi:hypothetical protein
MSGIATAIKNKREQIKSIQEDIAYLENLEIGRVYKFMDGYGSLFNCHVWAVLETCNKKSMRVRVLATDWKKFEDIEEPKNRWGTRTNILSLFYGGMKLTRAKKNDMALLMCLPFRSLELDEILKGRSRVKLDD